MVLGGFRWGLCLAAYLALAACKPTSGPMVVAASPGGAVAVAPVSAPLPVTKSDWSDAIKATYQEDSPKTDKDGITEFTACFKKAEDGKKCQDLAFGRRDSFRHLTTFTPAGSQLSEYSAWKYLHSYVSLLDCKRPNIVLSPHFFGKGGWLFMDKVAVMADGEVVLEYQFSNTEVQRDNNSWGVNERASWIASDSDYAALRKIADAKVVIVRLSGDKGIVTVPEADIKRLKNDFRSVIDIHSVLDSAAAGKQPANCK